MGATPTWFTLALVVFFAIDLVIVVLVLIAVRRKKLYRGFDVIVKNEQKKE